MFENIDSSLKYFRRSKKRDDSVAHRVLETWILSFSAKESCLTKYLSKALGTS